LSLLDWLQVWWIALLEERSKMRIGTHSAAATASLVPTGEPGRIHVSAATASLVPEVHWGEKTMQVKGKGEMQTFFYP
jgi:hypothetical protein